MTQTQSPMTSDTPYVAYGTIITQLLQASRHRRTGLMAAYGGGAKTISDIYHAYAVGVTGPRQSGKTHFAMEVWANDPNGTIVILPERALCQNFQDQLVGTNHQIRRQILTVDQLLQTTRQYSGDVEQKLHAQWTIDIDPKDTNPQATIARIIEEYHERREALLKHELPDYHPLRHVKTIIVDGMADGERFGLNFARLVRFSRLGGQCPEYILLN